MITLISINTDDEQKTLAFLSRRDISVIRTWRMLDIESDPPGLYTMIKVDIDDESIFFLKLAVDDVYTSPAALSEKEEPPHGIDWQFLGDDRI